MVSPRWKKVLRDLWIQKTRTLLVVLSIAVGVFAFGAVIASRVNIIEKLRSSYLAINPASAIIRSDPFDDDLVDVIRNMHGVAEAEGQRRVLARIKIGPDLWQDMEIFVIPDDGNMRINIVRPESGAWPPPYHALLVERASLPKTHASVGDMVLLDVGGEQHTLPIAGLSHDLSLPPAPIAGKAFGYITFDTLEWFNKTRLYDEMKIVVAEHRQDKAHIWNIVNQVARKIEDSGRNVKFTDVPTPLQHPAEQVIPTILFILGGLGVLTLLLGMFLIVNTIEAILTQHIKQIGIMKAIGARSSQIMQLYLGMVIAFGVLALVLAIPLGTLGALGFTRFMTNQLNIDLVNFIMPWYVLLLIVATALLLPALAAVPSIASAARMTVRNALDSNLSQVPQTGEGLIDRFTHHIRGIPRPLMLSLRNVFRRKGRLIRTLAVLSLAGAIFMSVLTVRASLFYTLDESVASKLYDIEVRFIRPYRSAKIEQGVLAIPGVTGVESWGFTTVYPVHADGSEGESMNLYAPPADTKLLQLRIVQGRWLRPDDQRAIVVSSNYVNKKEPGTRLGDDIILRINDEDEHWRIVGISQEFMSPVAPARGYVNYPTFARVAHKIGYVDNLQVATANHDPEYQQQIVRALEAHMERNDFKINLIQSTSQERLLLTERFNILTAMLSIMATLIAVVGGIGLTGTMSINVIERSKEIGIMRAIGASDGAIKQIVISEAMMIGVLSWAIAIVASFPFSTLLANQLGYNLLNEPLLYTYAYYAVLVWLVLVVLLSAIASLVPARNALRITIREVLAFE